MVEWLWAVDGYACLTKLPAETTAGTRLRISEALEGKAPMATWR